MTKTINLHSKYKSLRTESSRYFIVSGGRGSGKSFSIATTLLRLLYEEGQTILFTRYTLTSAEISIIPEFLGKIEMLGLEADFEITYKSIINIKTGSVIHFRGIKAGSGTQTANLKSIANITCWVLDEAEELQDEEIFNKIDESIRTKGIDNRVILIMNPTTKEHFVYNRFFVENGVKGGSNLTEGDTTYIHTTYLDNIENLSESFIANANKLKERRPEQYKSRMLGAWLDRAIGVIFENWVVGDFKETKSMIYGQDYGFKADASTLSKIAIDHDAKIIYLKECFYTHGMSTGDLFIANRTHAGNDLIIADNAEPRLINELDNLGNNIEPCTKGAGSINFGITLMQDYDLVVSPDSEHLINELKNYCWQKNKEQPIDNWNHVIDGIRYGVTYLIENEHRGVYNIG